MSLADEPGKVALECVIWNARKRDTLAFAHFARGQGDLKLPGSQPRVLVERLVEVAHAEEQQGVRVLPLDA